MNELLREFLRTSLKVVPMYLGITYIMCEAMTRIERVSQTLAINAQTLPRFWVGFFLGSFFMYLVVAMVVLSIIHARLVWTSQRTGLGYTLISWLYFRYALYNEKPLKEWRAKWVIKRYEELNEIARLNSQNRAEFKQRYHGSGKFMNKKGASN
jgi:hypothetical protein